jgi:CheY-like chemotaxis protein
MIKKNHNSKSIILYAEDDEDDQQLIKDSLQKYAHNIEIMIHNNGVEAVSYLNNLSPSEPAPCLIILDINMPKMNGIEALKQIRKNNRFAKTPAILFTTSSQPLDKKFAAEYKAGFITKPIDAAQMKYIAETFIEYCETE